MDFRELSSRLFYCEEDVRLNRPWAPDIYLDVVPISIRAGQPIVGGDGPTVEHAVRAKSRFLVRVKGGLGVVARLRLKPGTGGSKDPDTVDGD